MWDYFGENTFLISPIIRSHLQTAAPGNVHERMCWSFKWKWQLLDNAGVWFMPSAHSLWQSCDKSPCVMSIEVFLVRKRRKISFFLIHWLILRKLNNYPHFFLRTRSSLWAFHYIYSFGLKLMTALNSTDKFHNNVFH